MAADIRTYIDLEYQLYKRLHKTWRPIAAKLQADIVEALDNGDFLRAYDIARSIDLSPVANLNRQYIKYMLLACATFGASLATDSKTTFVSAGTYDKMLNTIVDAFCLAIKKNVTAQVYKVVVQSIAQANEEWKATKKADKPRFVREFVDFTEAGDSMLQLISSLHSSRLSTWGFTAEAELLGVTKYKLSAVLDGRTSDFCRMINGKVFNVADARASILTILSVDDPDAVKALQPWPKQDKESIEKYSKMTPEELTALGLHIPPFHPRCRTMLVRVEKAPRPRSPIQPTLQHEHNPKVESTKEMFAELGLSVTDDALKHWNDYIGKDPLTILSKLTGFTQQDILNGAIGKLYKSIVIERNGDIKLNAKLPVTGGGNLSTRMVFDPFNGELYLSYAEFRNASPRAAALALRKLIQNSIGLGEAISAATLSIVSGSDLGAVTYSRIGLLPSQSEWADIRNSILQQIEDGGLNDVFDALTSPQKALLLDLLQSKDVKAMQLIANLPFRIKGKSIAEILFFGVRYEAKLDLTNKEQIDYVLSKLGV